MKVKKTEPDQILYRVENALDALTNLIQGISRKAKKPAVYRQILNRRINLTKLSQQLRGARTVSIIKGKACDTAKNN